MITIAAIAIIAVLLGLWLRGHWVDINSVSDIEALYKTAVDRVNELKEKAKADIAEAEAKIEKLKSIL